MNLLLLIYVTIVPSVAVELERSDRFRRLLRKGI
jgi:hypothetical protein